MATPRSTRGLGVVLALLLIGSTGLIPDGAAARDDSQRTIAERGFRALSGSAARGFRLPQDTRLVSSFQLPALGLTIERHQQFVARLGASVDGGQLTVVRRDGRPVLVVGAYHPEPTARNKRKLDAGAAIGRAANDRRLRPERHAADEAGEPAQADDQDEDLAADHEVTREATLLLDPLTGRLFYRVESSGFELRQFHAVDAESGVVFDAYDALAHDHGRGVKRDRKTLVGGPGTTDNLTRKASGYWRMRSVDGRLITYDMANRWSGPAPVARDDDNHWLLARQRAAVDAQYYAAATDNFLRRRLGFDVLSATCGYGQIRSVVRFGRGYANAFWNGSELVYGNGDRLTFRPLSGAHDVVAHELTHAVTECTSDLSYWNESGALNEAFSDIVAVAAEFDLAEPISSNCLRAAGQSGCADWSIGEDVWLGAGHGIRSLAVPSTGAQPSHYSARYTGDSDNGGVHINSGIPAHAFYLMSEGGRNAGCAGPGDAPPDCDVLVPGIGIAAARQIAFLAYTTLPANAKFCAARAATMAAADALYPGSLRHVVAADLSWSAVGLGTAACEAAQSDFHVTLGERSIYLAPGGGGQLSAQLARGSETGSVSFSVAGLPSGWYTLDPTTSSRPAHNATTLSLTVPAGAADGGYPFRLRASSSSRSVHASGLLIVDATPPSVVTPNASLARGTVVPADTGKLPVRVSWAASDDGSGLADARLEWSAGGGEWTDVTPAAGVGAPALVRVGPGAHSFRVRATDRVGNAVVSAPSVPVSVSAKQESSATFSAGWSAPVTQPAWGTLRTTSERDRSVTLSFTGAEVAWVAEKGPGRGRARVYLDGVFVGRVDLYATSVKSRTVVFAAGGLASASRHTLRIVTLGTLGRPLVGVDGFLVLSR